MILHNFMTWWTSTNRLLEFSCEETEAFQLSYKNEEMNTYKTQLHFAFCLDFAKSYGSTFFM